MKATSINVSVPAFPVTFQDASQEDFPEIIALARRIWPVAYAAIISAAQNEYMLSKFYTPGYLQAERDSGIGFVLVCRAGERIGFFAYGPSTQEGEALLHKVYLLTEHQGQGIGSAMLREAKRRASDAGFRTLSLNVNRRNGKALRAYLRNGFQKRSEIVTEVGNGYVRDDFVLVCELGDA